ncbi:MULTISPECIES: 4Fe-4S dicluster domain-containing protein [Protofrankia]|uniref:4Fe-4S ferredoxin iron-sulfur binding domain-containing protein n=1 Tax=Candidatus Protofrankia datiscae TaxID=2716812 RepID=F8B0P1_9ACTN|nr:MULTISPECIES: ferredoxin family protein [Protofrankia]AEH10673.1 4Fe-4S ferredoxin iron-sulfur binding domain-containing protein [Candidatus Protofrankia datiscae]
MIEVVSGSRCVDCNICVEVCPTNVFDAVDGGHPVIARQPACQTCFMCEAYCPADALFVAPLAGPAPAGSPLRDEAFLEAHDRFGEYRRWLGWGHGRRPGSLLDRNHVFTARLGPAPEASGR